MKKLQYLFLFCICWILLFCIFIFLQVVYSFSGIMKDPYETLGLLWTVSCVLCISLGIYFLGKMIYKYVPWKYMIWWWVIYLLLLCVYLLCYTYIPLKEDYNSLLQFRENNKQYERTNPLFYTQFEEIKQHIVNLSSKEEKEKYAQKILWDIAQEYYDDTVDVYTKKYVREWFFYDSEQFFEYKKQSFSKVVSHLNYETSILYGKDVSLVKQMLSWLIKRENFYDSYGGDIEKLKNEKNQILDIVYSKE